MSALEEREETHEPRPLDMEFPSYGRQQIVRLGRWKAVRQDLHRDPRAAIELCDIATDRGESRDAAAENGDIVAEPWRVMIRESRNLPDFPFPALDRVPA
jgi:hypothetical protein